MVHELPLERRTLHGHLSRELAAVVTVDPGDTVAFTAPNAGWRWERGRELFATRDPVLDEGHPLCGPVEVRGARAGQTLVVGIDEVAVAGWGVTIADELVLHWTVDDDAGTATDERGTVVGL